MRVKITKVPSKNKLEKAAYGGQTANGALNINPTSYFGGGRAKDDLSQARTGRTLTAVPRDKANLEAEGGETAFGPISGESIPDHYTIKGARHTNGGVPLDLPDDTFIFSDTKSMKITDPRILKMFGKKAKKGGYTPAELAKPYDINKYKSILMDPDSDRKERETATLMIKNFIIKLGALALAQESKKGFPQGIPEMAKPYMESIGLKEEDILPQQQQMPPEQMMAQQQGPPPTAPPGAMDPNQMEEVLQQEQQMMPPQEQMMRFGGNYQGLDKFLGRAKEGMQQPSPEEMVMMQQQAMQQQEGQPQMQEGQDQMMQLMQAVGQALEQGQDPMELMAQLIQDQVPPQTVAQVFMEIGMPEEEVVQSLEMIMQQMQGGQAPEEAQMMPPQMEQPMPMPMAAYGMELGGYDMPFVMANGGYADMLPSYQGDAGGSEVSDDGGGMCKVRVKFTGKQNRQGGDDVSDFDQGTDSGDFVKLPCAQARELQAAQKAYYASKQKVLDYKFDVNKGVLNQATGEYIPFSSQVKNKDRDRVTGGGDQEGTYTEHGWGDPSKNLYNEFSVNQVNAIAPEFYNNLTSLAQLHNKYIKDQKIPDMRGKSEIAADPNADEQAKLTNTFGPRQFALNYEMGEIQEDKCVCKHPDTGAVMHTWNKTGPDDDCSSEGKEQCVVSEDKNTQVLEEEYPQETPQYSDAAVANMINQNYDTSVDYMTNLRIDPKMTSPALKQRYDADVFSAMADASARVNQGPGSASDKLMQNLAFFGKGLDATAGKNKAVTDFNITAMNTIGNQNAAREQQAAAQNAQMQFKTDAFNIGQTEKQTIAKNVMKQAKGLALLDAEKELREKMMWNQQNPNYPISYKTGLPEGFQRDNRKFNPYKTKTDTDIINECQRDFGADTQQYKDCVKMKMEARDGKKKKSNNASDVNNVNNANRNRQHGGYVSASMMYPFNSY